ncbi:MAG: rhodanese-like domain-containing protein [Anaerolineae bacterium]
MRTGSKSISGVERLARQKASWLGAGLLLALLAVISLSIAGCGSAPVAGAQRAALLPDEISVDQAHQKYQAGVFFLDVRTRQEWDEYHIPSTTLIPLDQLESRLDELPQDGEIVVVCRSGNRSQAGRDILRNNGFEQATSMSGGLKMWRAAGYPVE